MNLMPARVDTFEPHRAADVRHRHGAGAVPPGAEGHTVENGKTTHITITFDRHPCRYASWQRPEVGRASPVARREMSIGAAARAVTISAAIAQLP